MSLFISVLQDHTKLFMSGVSRVPTLGLNFAPIRWIWGAASGASKNEIQAEPGYVKACAGNIHQPLHLYGLFD